MFLENSSRFPVVNTPEIQYLRNNLGHKIRDYGCDPSALKCIWHPITRRYCAALVTNELRGEYWVIDSWARGGFSRDNVDKVWFNLDQTRRHGGIHDWVQKQVEGEKAQEREHEASEREMGRFRNFLRKRLHPNVDPSILRLL